MLDLTFRPCLQALLCAVALTLLANSSPGQPFGPTDAGTTVSGYQDDFNGASLAAGWQMLGANVYAVSNGALHVTTATGDPNHLLYAVAGYNNSVQEVLARVRVLNFGTGDPPRGGISVCVDPAASPAGGMDLHFRDENLGRHIEFLDDLRAWGTEYQYPWQNNTWYWLRLRHEANAASQGGVNDVFAKIWPADGSAAEPAAWQDVYDYIPTRASRTGYAGIVAGSSGGTSEFEVDYILIKASGLPSITVSPAAFNLTQTPAAITNPPQSQIVGELQPASFSAGVGGNPPPTLQWYKNDAVIPGATNASYSIPNSLLVDDGARFTIVAANVASNISYVATSSVAILTVVADTNPPVLLSARAVGLSQVQVFFSERISAITATNPANYSITSAFGNLTISNALLDVSQSNVVLNVSPLTEGVSYTLTANGLRDPSAAANQLAPNSQATFVAVSYAAQDIGAPAQPGGIAGVPGGYNITGGGTDIGGTSDQFQFSYQQRSGDFDVKVRLDSLGLSDAWAEAGLMARESLATGSRFASVMATPTISGSYFQSRSTTNGATALSGSFPVNYPNTWLRIQRAGSQFNGFASLDGQNWTLLGTVSIAMPANIYFGFAVASHNTNQITTAAFRDFGAVTGVTTNVARPTSEPLGQADRKTGLLISEIMYHPGNTRGTMNTNADGFVTNSLEFIELFNSMGTPEDISGFRISGDIDYTFPPGTVLPGGGFLVIAKSPIDLMSVYGITGVLGPYANSLPNSSGTVRLRNRIGAVYLEATYDSQAPWPVAPDGGGHSLVLARPSFGQGNPLAWAASDSVGGSPGKLDPVSADPARKVLINEFLAHTDDATPDFIELYNSGNQPIDISGCTLSDDPDVPKFMVPPSTILGPRSFISWDQTQLGFSLSASGETIWFRNAAGTRVLDALRFEAQANGISFGRFPDGAPILRALSGKTPGTNNSVFLASDIIINEIMYHPISGNDDDQFVELYNKGTNTISLAGWRFTSGINFTFPSNALVNPDGYAVVARNSARLLSNYPALGPGNVFGDFGGTLSRNGERLALARPELLLSTNSHGVVTTNMLHVVVNEVAWSTGGRWGQWSDGGGSSLELMNPRSDNSMAANWADSDETTKASWGVFSFSGTLDNGDVAADELQVLLLGSGECLIDDVEVLNAASANVIANSSFETDATGWTAEGTEATSGLESSSGYNSGKSYRVRAIERGDNQVNRIRTPLTSALPSLSTATIRAKARWLRGHPEVLFRLRGKWLELFCSMPLPANLGTPGARNSRAVTNAPPAIADVMHNPVLPAANQPCVVTARVTDADKPVAVTLKYRLDPSASYSSVAMTDDGTGADAMAGDGIYSGTIPGQASGTMAPFYIQATDGLGASSVFPNNAPVRECLVRFGEVQPTGNFPVYRIWMTQNTLSTWTSRSKLNNTPLDVTFVLGDRRVIYNTTALYAGSPYIAPGYTSPTAGRCGYTLTFPADDLFLGGTDLVLDWPGGHGNENTAMQEQMGYYIADKINLPFSHRYIIRLHVNGVTDTQRSAVFEAVNQPNSDFVKAWLPDQSDGDFYKIDRGFEFDDAGNRTADPMPRLDNYITTGGLKKTSRYRWNFYKRAGSSAAVYTNIFNLVDASNSAQSEPYNTLMSSLIDIEEWMRIQAVEHIIVNFDSWGHEIGKNMYGYKPDGGKWQLYMFDLDWLMLAAPAHVASYAASTASMFTCEDPNITRMFNHPPFRRAYFRAMQDAVDGPLQSANCNPVMDAKYASLVNNGVQFCDGQALGAPTAVKQWFSDRRGYLVSQLATVAAPFTTPNLITTGSNVVTLSGTAPVTVKDILVNGSLWPVTWTSISNWTLRLPVSGASNLVTVAGFDGRGNPLAGASNAVTVLYTNSVPPAEGTIVFNEIMYHPVIPGAEYVELLNTSTNFTFDLSGWRINGLSYTFPAATTLAPRSFLLLVKSRAAATQAYGTNIAIFAEFDGNLQSNGETLTLLKPGASGAPDLTVSKVRFENTAPWPTGANGSGSSLQLIDPGQDNARVANWSDGSGWRHYVNTSLKGGNALDLWLTASNSELYIDNISLVLGSVPETGPNLLLNGDFEDGTNYFRFIGNHTNSFIASGTQYSGSNSLHMVSGTTLGSAVSRITQSLTNVSVSATYSLSFYYLPLTNSVGLRVGLGSSTNFILNVQRASAISPGANNTSTASLPPFPLLWLNEVQPENVNGITDNNGQRDPWLELYNSSSVPIALDGFTLANNYTNLAQWTFPTGATLNPGEFRILFVDGEPGQSTSTEWHTSFRLSPGTGSLALSRNLAGAPQIVDYLNYSGIGTGRSYGAFPDGQLFDRQEFYYVTPAGTNNGALAPIVVSINEWMAANSSTIGDPASLPNKFDDWFELYNPGTNAVDLAGYYLTDTLTNKFQYQIPAGYKIPAAGHLLVWADNEPGQNNTNLLDLHVNFQLSKSGEALGLFAPDGTQIDAVTFGSQTTDVSQGRYPDGSPNIYSMPTPTPRSANLSPFVNTPPILSHIGDRVVHKGQTVTFTASASDSDTPPQTLLFSLDPGAPDGAAIDPVSGVFSWATTGLPTPLTNAMIIRVRDNGSPSLTAFEVVTITVLAPPGFNAVSRSGDLLTLGWSAIPGRTYRIEATDDLTAGNWQPLGEDIPVADTSPAIQVDINSSPQRFFRMMVVQ